MALTKLFRDFFNSEKIGGVLLLCCTIASLLIANWGDGAAYEHFWHRHLDLSFGGLALDYSIEHWVNDGLMAIFFLLVGLEIERELHVGELSSFRHALLPIGAAIGGMLVPALIHYAFNGGLPTQSGFGIPMATDIAFALGMLALAGNRVPFSLKVFLTALAIIDDLGAILVIAIFYNQGLDWTYFGGAAGIFALMMLINKLKVYWISPYLLLGVALWYCMLKSGIHATIAGVLVAIAVPFSKDDRTNPSFRLQHALHKPVAFIILPIFALANTGIILQENWAGALGSPNSLGIMAGLVLGKPVGILLCCWLLTKLKWAGLPQGVGWKHLAGAAVLAGIGFTMSIFISNLAFTDGTLIQASKITVLLSSLLATVFGLMILFTCKRDKEVV